MKRIITVALLAATLAACTASQVASTTSAVCADITKLPPVAVGALNAQAPSSALGVLWADAKSGCANGAPTVGVDTSWTGMVWGAARALAPTVVPMLIGLL